MNNKPVDLPGGLPLFVSGWGAGNIKIDQTESFWDDVLRVTSEGLLTDHVDAAMTGRSSPRVWLFLHEPGESQLSIVSALAFARELARRDQAVLLLDGDDNHADLTNWSGRKDVDGWIDLVRYGASVLTSGEPMPFEGRRGYLLGVGSFTPAEVTGSEVKDLLTRLKRQADDILVVAPCDAVGRLWAAEADMRLVCWDRAHRSVSLVEDLVDNFSAIGMPLTGIVGFGLPKKIEEEPADIVDEVLAEESSGAASAVFDDLEKEDDDFVHEEEEFARRKGNSGIFYIATMAFVILIGAASVYFMKFLRVPSEGHFPASAQHEVALGGAAFFDSGAGVIIDDTVVVEEEHSSPDQAAAEELIKQGNVAEEPVAAADSGIKEDPTTEETVPVVVDVEPDTPALDVVEEASEVVVSASGGPVFNMNPYMMPVGSGGWALHVYSFPDSLQADKEQKILAGKGFKSASRVVQLKDKGRWIRLYVGSFNTKAEANSARIELMEKLGEDWVNPARF